MVGIQDAQAPRGEHQKTRPRKEEPHQGDGEVSPFPGESRGDDVDENG